MPESDDSVITCGGYELSGARVGHRDDTPLGATQHLEPLSSIDVVETDLTKLVASQERVLLGEQECSRFQSFQFQDPPRAFPVPHPDTGVFLSWPRLNHCQPGAIGR